MYDEDSLENCVRMGSALNSVVHKHCHAFPQAQLDMQLMQSMYRLALEVICIHRIDHARIWKQEERQCAPEYPHVVDMGHVT